MRRGTLVAVLATALIGMCSCTTSYSRIEVATPDTQSSATPTPITHQQVFVSADRRSLLVPVRVNAANQLDECWYRYFGFATQQAGVVRVMVDHRPYMTGTAPTPGCAQGTSPRPWYVRVELSTPYRRQEVVDFATGRALDVRVAAHLASDRIVDVPDHP